MPPGLDRLEGARPNERDPRSARPTHRDEHGVAESGPPGGELPAVDCDVGDIPVEAGVEPGRKACGDVGREDRRGKENVLGSGGGGDSLECVNARLRQRSLEVGPVYGIDRCDSECTRRRSDLGDAVPYDDACNVTADGKCPCEHAQRALLDRAAMMLEKDEGAHRSFLPASHSTSCSAADPSSSILI